MCNLYRMREPAAEIARIFDAIGDTTFDTAMDLYPKSQALVVRAEDGQRAPVRVINQECIFRLGTAVGASSYHVLSLCFQVLQKVWVDFARPLVIVVLEPNGEPRCVLRLLP